MAEHKTGHTLTFQLMAMICIAAAVAVLVGLGSYAMGLGVVQRFYLSDAAVSRRTAAEIESFRSYVSDNAVASTDVTAVEQWNRDHPYTQLTIRGLSTTISSNINGAELMGNETGVLIQSGLVASSGMEFPVHFRDGSFSVVVYESSEKILHQIIQLTAILVGTLVFLVIVLLYDQRVTHSIQTLSRQVRQVSLGDLDLQIRSTADNEIGQLATDVDTMRLSIIEKLQREEAAWQANSQLITAISHDVRTPLTALMGYLELLDDPAVTAQERSAYLEICKNNAQRLKGLTDELFGFFLVFGKPEVEKALEDFDGSTLLDQILMEHEMSLKQAGFDVRSVSPREPIGTLRVDLGHLRRVFDNLFSNVSKYADPTRPVGIVQRVEGGRLSVSIINAIPKTRQRVESNKIGLQTCQKLVSTMGGEFKKYQTEDSFTAEVILPVF